jgi:autotransporter translocation and assembly factor TamB
MGTAWTELLREVVEDDARTGRAQRLATTFTWCAMGLLAVVLVTVLTVAALAYGAVGWVPVAGGGGLFGLLGIARWMVVRRRACRIGSSDPPTTGSRKG